MTLNIETSKTLGITLVRIFAGYLIFRYGRELFNIDGLLNFLKEKAIPFPVFTGYAAKIIELVGGILLIFGLFTRIVSILLMIVMYGVIYTTADGNFLEGEFPFLYMLLFAVFLLSGAGRWSLDYLWANRKKRKEKQLIEGMELSV